MTIALFTYITNRKIENVKGLIELRKLLTTENNMRIHKLIGSSYSENDKVDDKCLETNNFSIKNGQNDLYDTYNYLGTLEISKTFLDCHIIDKDSFIKQFGYRLSNIANNEALLEIIECEQLTENSWSDLFSLLKEYVKGYTFPSTTAAKKLKRTIIQK